ncbi:MAG: hypothetical protein DKT66_12695 [Candidatus Melainabacteria bacterium]|nr:MAG: hypothetical protein DKT66_12695 [Candidatus Melainabacteria bacterium]
MFGKVLPNNFVKPNLFPDKALHKTPSHTRSSRLKKLFQTLLTIEQCVCYKKFLEGFSPSVKLVKHPLSNEEVGSHILNGIEISISSKNSPPG